MAEANSLQGSTISMVKFIKQPCCFRFGSFRDEIDNTMGKNRNINKMNYYLPNRVRAEWSWVESNRINNTNRMRRKGSNCRAMPRHPIVMPVHRIIIGKCFELFSNCAYVAHWMNALEFTNRHQHCIAIIKWIFRKLRQHFLSETSFKKRTLKNPF